MRIAYLVYWNLDAGDGVARKIAAQLRAWRDAGQEVEAFQIEPGGLRERWRRTTAAVREVEAFEPDVVYLRYDLFLPPVWGLARRLPIVAELNGDDRREYALRGFGAATLGRLGRRFVIARASGFVPVTHEIARTVEHLGRPVEVVSNGADPDVVPWAPAPAHERPRAVFSGSPDLAWHGVDVLLDIAAALPGVDFDLVGPTPPSHPRNVTVHGRLDGAAYFDVFGAADFAFGSLALERAGLSEGCPLKVREYLLAGLPVVLAYEDTDFIGEQAWYLLRSTEPAEIAEFAERVRGRRVDRAEAERRVSSRVKEEQRLRFLQRFRKQIVV